MNDPPLPPDAQPCPPATVSVHRPMPALEPYVTFYYSVTTTCPISDFLYPEWGNVRIALAGDWQVTVEGAYAGIPTADALLFGPTDRRSLVTASAGRMVGFGLTPIGWSRLVAGNAATLANGVRPLDGEMGMAPDALRAALATDKDEATSAARWDALLGRLFATRPPADPRTLAVDTALRRGPADVAAFADLLGLSERSLHRLCLHSFGFPPKRLLRRQRFLRTLGRVRSAVRDPVTPSLGEDYYDLPQFYRDFRDFMGMSARAYFAAPRDLMGPAAVAQQRAGVTLSFALAPPEA